LTTREEPVEAITAAASEEKRKLQKSFRRFDIFFFLICTLVGVDTIGTVANTGAQGFTWLAFVGIAFFLPYGLIVAEVGSAFTEEGGCYVWTQLAFGYFIAAVNTVIYWVSVPIWVGGSLAITALKAADTFFAPVPGALRYVFTLAFIAVSVGAAILSFRIGKWIPTLGAWARFLVLSFFTFSVALYAFRHGLHGFTGHAFLPTYAVFIAAVPAIVYNYVGFELPNSAGDEMTDPQRDVPFTVALSALGTILLYGAPILAILLVLPTERITSLGGFLDAIKAVFTVYGGQVDSKGAVTLLGAGKVLGGVGALLFIMSLISSGTTWLMGGDRSLAVAGYSGAGPRVLGTFSARFGTPIVANLFSGFIAILLMVLAFVLSHGNSEKYFSAVLNLAISTTTISYLAIFPAAIRLRYTHPDRPRPYRIPFGNAGVWICGLLATFWTLVATIVLLWPGLGVGWFHTGGDPDSSLPAGFTHERWQYELTQIVPLALIILTGILFYFLGRRNRAQAASPSRPE